MRMRYFVIILLAFSCCLGPIEAAHGQQSSSESGRVVIHRTEPHYPDLARKMSIGGTVKVFAIVAPDGKVKSVEPAGGHPVLIEAARQAISEWKFAPASTESKELIELHFTPH
jgi:TonB family protein